jgi:hypothetical protein
MSVFLFDRDVRSHLTEIPIGKNGIAFDRLDLDSWAEHHKQANGRPPGRRTLWLEREPASPSEVGFGGSRRRSTGGEYEKAREQVILQKRKGT